MGKSAPPPPYRDDATQEDDVSLHTTQGEDDILDVIGAPPSYSDSEVIRVTSQIGIVENPYVIKPLKNCNGVDIIMDPRFDTDAVYAEEAIRKWSSIRPAQMIQIKGTHTQTVKNGNKEEKQTITDFDIKLRLTEYLLDSEGSAPWARMYTVSNNEKTHRGTIFKTRAKAPQGGVAADLLEAGKPELKEWCHLFCASHANLKRFRVSRIVTGLDTRFLEDNLKSLVRNTNYRGHTSITFPIENKAVEVYNTNRINTWRMTTWVCMIFYITFLWLLTWPYLFFATKRWAVVKIEWPFSVLNDDGDKCFTSISERQLFDKWAQVIETAVLGKKQGALSEEDLSNVDRPQQSFQSGHSEIDRAVSFLGAGVRAYNEVNRQLGWGGDC